MPAVAPSSSRTTARCRRSRSIWNKQSLHARRRRRDATGRSGAVASPAAFSTSNACTIPIDVVERFRDRRARGCTPTARCAARARPRATSLVDARTRRSRGVMTSRTRLLAELHDAADDRDLRRVSPTPSSSPSRSSSSSRRATGVADACSRRAERAAPSRGAPTTTNGASTISTARRTGSSTGARPSASGARPRAGRAGRRRAPTSANDEPSRRQRPARRRCRRRR